MRNYPYSFKVILCVFSWIFVRKEINAQILDSISSKPQWVHTISWEWPNSTGISPGITSMVEYNKLIYVSKRDGLYKLNKDKNKLMSFHNGLNLKKQSDSAFTKLIVHKNQMYAASLFNGIYRLDHQKKQWEHLNYAPLDTTLFDIISCHGILYAPSHDYGLFQWDEKTKKWIAVKGEKGGSLWSCGCIDSVLWVGNKMNQLFRLHPKTYELKKIIKLGEPDMDQNNIIGFGITGILGLGDTIWSACHAQGIFKSTDQGKTWPDNPIPFAATQLFPFQTMIFVSNTLGNHDGLFQLNPSNHELQKIELGLENQYIMYFTSIDQSVYINNLHGIWEISIDDFKRYYLK